MNRKKGVFNWFRNLFLKRVTVEELKKNGSKYLGEKCLLVGDLELDSINVEIEYYLDSKVFSANGFVLKDQKGNSILVFQNIGENFKTPELNPNRIVGRWSSFGEKRFVLFV